MAESNERYDLDALSERVSREPGCPDFPALAEAVRRAGEPERARSIAERGLEAAPGRLAGRVALGLALLDLGRDGDAERALAPILDEVLEPHRTHDEADEVLDVTDDQLLLDVAEPADASVGVEDDELDAAFAVAEPQVDEMISPNRMAERVLLDHAPIPDDVSHDDIDRDIDRDVDHEIDQDVEKHSDRDGDDESDAVAGFDAASPLFRTATMAELLDRQGDVARAEAIRRELTGVPPQATDAAIVPEWPAVDDVAPMAAESDAPDAVVDPQSGDGYGDRSARILSTLERWLQNIQRGMA